MPDDTLNHWEHTARDVVPNLVPGGAPRDVGADLLVALLGSEGMAWSPPYEDVRRQMGVRKKRLSDEEQAPGDQRIRTYMALYRSLGLTYEDSGKLEVTPAGDNLRELVTGYYDQVDAFGLAVTPSLRRAVARIMLPVLARVQLDSPIAAGNYPDGTDIHPLRALWKAAREAEDKLHWEEISRRITPCLREADLDGAIARIQKARGDNNYDPNSPNSCDEHLGPRLPDLEDVREQKDRLTIPWLSKAAFKNIIFETNDAPDGFRHLVPDVLPLLDAVLARPVEHRDFETVGDYMDWVGSALPLEGGADQEKLSGVLVASAVPRDLLRPPPRVGLGRPVVLRTAMPPAADRFHRQGGRAKDDVVVPTDVREHPAMDAEPQPPRMETAAEFQFRCGVLRPLPGHALAHRARRRFGSAPIGLCHLTFLPSQRRPHRPGCPATSAPAPISASPPR